MGIRHSAWLAMILVVGMIAGLQPARGQASGPAPADPNSLATNTVLREEAGQPRFELGGNFLIRSRRHWLDDETLVIAIDAPSDQWASFSQLFRQGPRYGADVAALLAEATRRYAVSDWTLVGNSEGSVSAFHAARMNPGLAQRLILTSSLFLSGGNGPGLSGTSWDAVTARLLWVHHEDDGCRFTPHRSARQFAKRPAAPALAG